MAPHRNRRVQRLRRDTGVEPSAVGSLLPPVLRRLGGGAISVATVADRWEEVVGVTVAAHARPSGVRGDRLLLTVDDPAWATQLRWLETELLDRIERATGEPRLAGVDVLIRAR